MTGSASVLRFIRQGTCGLAIAAAILATPPVAVVTAQQADEPVRSEHLLPENTKLWVSVPDAQALRDAIQKTRFGKMTEDPEVKPFVDDLVRQFQDFLDQQNVQFGMKLSDLEDVRSGEICVAGILRAPVAGAADAAPDHALVLMVDVLDTVDEAHALLDKVAEEFREREATSETMTIGSVEATKWTFKLPRGLREQQFAWHAIAGRWLLACDNEGAFRDVIGQIGGATGGGGMRHLAENAAFQSVMAKSNFDDEGYPLHLRWFIEPLGYIDLAQEIAESRNGRHGPRNNYAKILRDEGFSAVRGIGGGLTIATGSHEAAHRTFVYAPHSAENPLQRGAAMLDFSVDSGPLAPAEWVPEHAASVLSLSWDLPKAFESVGLLIESLAGTEGSFIRAVNDIRDNVNGPRVDLRKLISLLEKRVTVVAVTQLPVDENSERMTFGVRILQDEPYVAESVYRLVRNNADAPIDHEGTKIYVIDTREEYERSFNQIDDDLLNEEFDDQFGKSGLEEDAQEEDLEEFKRPKPLFEKRVVAVSGGWLLIGNSVEEIKALISGMSAEPGKALAEAEDWQRVRTALEELAGDAPPGFRHFGRMDRELRTNYEMMRQGRMGESKTLLAQLINRAVMDETMPEGAVREQKLDGSRMPEDFEGKVAQYFGPTGLVLHTVEDGWLLTGCVLAKAEGTDGSGNESETATGTSTGTEPAENDSGK